jgi:two-component system nitrogen regulation sensor histidine kinase GlnL
MSGADIAKELILPMVGTMPKSLPQQLLENLNTAVLLVDGNLMLSAINPAGEMLFETGSRQATGQPLTHLLPHNQALIEAMHQTLVSGHPFTEHGLRLGVPVNRWITVDCTVTPVLRADGDGELILEINPIDRLLRLAREESRHDQHAASRAVIRGLAHEIKNPLGGLRGAAQLLERELPSESLKEYTRIIIHEADRLRNLVDRMVGPNTPLRKKPMNIHRVMDHVRSLILAEVPAGIHLERDYDPSLPEFPADAEQLTQAVLNIARNAVQALNQEGTIEFRTRIERQFTIGQRRHRLVVRAEIEDNGPGIPEELREHIFYPMVTSKSNGTGLGLSIAQDIVDQHGGIIECSSRPGRTIFRIYLPLDSMDGGGKAVSRTTAEENGHG